MKVSVVLPAYNEAKRLRKTVERVEEQLITLGYDYEIVIAEDGSTDGTDAIAREIAEKNPRVKHLHSDERLGRGRALMNAFRICEGEVVVYMDIDLSTDLRHLGELISAVLEGYDVVTGSRLIKGSEVRRPLKRDVASRAYNLLVRILLRSRIHDHQCGFKAFRKSAILKISELVKDTHWFWDTEVLVLAQRLGFRVKEIPVRWEHGGETKVRFGKDVVYMFSQILRVFLEDVSKSRKFYLFASILAITLLLLLAISTGVSNFVESVSALNPQLVALASILYASSFALRGFRLRYIVSRIGENCSLKTSTFAVSIGQTLNVITPARLGDVARAYVLKRFGVSYTTSLGATAVERFFDLLSIAFIAVLASIYLGTRKIEVVYTIAFALLILIAIIGLSRMKNLIGTMMKKARVALNPKDSIALVFLSSLLWLGDILVCYLIALGFNVSFATIALAVAIGNVVKAIPITPGGIGTYELTLTAIIGFHPYSFAIAFADHAIKNIVTLIFGVIAFAATNLSIKEVKG